MSVEKNSSCGRSASQTEPPRPIAGPSVAHPRALPQPTPSPQIAVAATSVAPRSILRTAAQLADAAGDILLAAASWMLMEALAGCFAYGMAMYGIPEAMNNGEAGAPMPSASPDPRRNSSRPTLHVILADAEGHVGADEILPPDAAGHRASRSSQ